VTRRVSGLVLVYGQLNLIKKRQEKLLPFLKEIFSILSSPAIYIFSFSHTHTLSLYQRTSVYLPFPSLSDPLSLSLYVSVSLSLSTSTSLFLSLSLSRYHSRSCFFLNPPQSLSLPTSLSLSFCLFVSLCVSLSLSILRFPGAGVSLFPSHSQTLLQTLLLSFSLELSAISVSIGHHLLAHPLTISF